MKSTIKLVAALVLMGTCIAASANTWVRGVEIEILQVNPGAAFVIVPTGGPLQGCEQFKFQPGRAFLSATAAREQYAMALAAFLLGKRVDIFFDATSSQCFSLVMALDQLQNP